MLRRSFLQALSALCVPFTGKPAPEKVQLRGFELSPRANVECYGMFVMSPSDDIAEDMLSAINRFDGIAHAT